MAAILLHPGTVDTDLSRPFQKVGLHACDASIRRAAFSSRPSDAGMPFNLDSVQTGLSCWS